MPNMLGLKFWFCFLSKPSFVFKQMGFVAFVNATKKLSIFLLFRKKIFHFAFCYYYKSIRLKFPKIFWSNWFNEIKTNSTNEISNNRMNFLQTKKSPTSLKSLTVFNIEIRNIFNFQIGSRMQPPKKKSAIIKKRQKTRYWMNSVICLLIVECRLSMHCKCERIVHICRIGIMLIWSNNFRPSVSQPNVMPHCGSMHV